MKTKELIAIAVGHVTQCPYCIDVHTKKAIAAGATEQEVAESIFVAIALRAGGSLHIAPSPCMRWNISELVVMSGGS